MGDIIEVAFLLTPWLIVIKYPKQITLCDTNTVILLVILTHSFDLSLKKLSGITNPKKFHVAGW